MRRPELTETVSPLSLQMKWTLHNHDPLTVCVVFPQRFRKQHFISLFEVFSFPDWAGTVQSAPCVLHISSHRSGSSPGLFFSAPTLWPCLLLLKAPAGPAGSEDHRGTSLFILCGGPHFSLLSCLFIPALSVWVRVCGPCHQFWPQCMLMASEDVKYSWQGLVCAPQPHLERLFVLNMRLMEQTGYVCQGPSHQWRSKLTVTADDWTKWVFVKVSGSFLCFVDTNFNHGAEMCL